MTGQLTVARARVEDGYKAATDGETAAVWAGLLGVVAKAQGHLDTATAALREAVTLTTERRILRPCLAELACVTALLGDTVQARALLDRADELARPSNRCYDAWVELDRAWVCAADGAMSVAVDAARRAAELARKTDQPTFEALALYDIARLGSPANVRERLATLSLQLGCGFVATLSRAARALVSHGSDELEQAAHHCAKQGHLLLAAELHTAAARAFQQTGRTARARTAAGRAGAILAGHCRGARTPLLALDGPSAVLTPREREIAVLATSLSSRRIADQLRLSVHTVNNTLARAYTKLGIRSREELTELLGGTTGRGPARGSARR